MRKSRILLFCLCITLSCTSTNSNTDYDPSIDFSKLEKYAWLPDQPQGQTRILHTNSLRLNRIKKAIDGELLAKGLTQTQRSEADFLIRSLVSEEMDDLATPVGHSPDHDPAVQTPVPKPKSASRYENVALIVDFLEPHDENLIWRGKGEVRIRRDTTAKAREASIEELADRILSSYPPETVK
ncbi:DUF4136 domain-containing protein [Myxococcota bacterium]|nr:DUF4136 domain-containing protein [Myxococcota bacterium]